MKSKKEIKIKARKFIKYEVIKRKMEDINKLIENIFNKKFNNLDENLFINKVKNYIKEFNFDESEKICRLNFNFTNIIKITSLLLKEKEINWLEFHIKETTSISSYLYFMQNKKQ